MQYGFKAMVVVEIEHQEGWTASKHLATKFNLETIGPLKREMYIENDLPTKMGSEALSITLVQGLVGNIHLAHDKGWRDSAEHFRWIISELEKGFAAVANVQKSRF